MRPRCAQQGGGRGRQPALLGAGARAAVQPRLPDLADGLGQPAAFGACGAVLLWGRGVGTEGGAAAPGAPLASSWCLPPLGRQPGPGKARARQHGVAATGQAACTPAPLDGPAHLGAVQYGPRVLGLQPGFTAPESWNYIRTGLYVLYKPGGQTHPLAGHAPLGRLPCVRAHERAQLQGLDGHVCGVEREPGDRGAAVSGSQARGGLAGERTTGPQTPDTTEWASQLATSQSCPFCPWLHVHGVMTSHCPEEGVSHQRGAHRRWGSRSRAHGCPGHSPRRGQHAGRAAAGTLRGHGGWGWRGAFEIWFLCVSKRLRGGGCPHERPPSNLPSTLYRLELFLIPLFMLAPHGPALSGFMGGGAHTRREPPHQPAHLTGHYLPIGCGNGIGDGPCRPLPLGPPLSSAPSPLLHSIGSAKQACRCPAITSCVAEGPPCRTHPSALSALASTRAASSGRRPAGKQAPKQPTSGPVHAHQAHLGCGMRDVVGGLHGGEEVWAHLRVCMRACMHARLRCCVWPCVSCMPV